MGRVAALAVLAAALAIAACGEKEEPDTGASPDTAPDVPAGADDVVLQVSSGGGYVPEIGDVVLEAQAARVGDDYDFGASGKEQAEVAIRPAIGTETRCSET